MNGLSLNHWLVRAGIVAGLTWIAWKYLPLGAVGKTVVLGVGGSATAAIVGANFAPAAALLSGQPLALAASS